MKRLRWGMLGLAAAGLTTTLASAQRPDWNKPFARFKIIGNIYHVG